MQIDLSGKSAFVSGSTQGIGRAIVARLAECGAVAYVNGRDAARVDAVVAELRALGATVATGRFRTSMAVELVNDGPVTLVVDAP